MSGSPVAVRAALDQADEQLLQPVGLVSQAQYFDMTFREQIEQVVESLVLRYLDLEAGRIGQFRAITG